MVLILNGIVQNKPPETTKELYKAYPNYKERAKNLIALEKKCIGPQGLLYVMQREFAVLGPNEEDILFVGADDVTTCILAVLRDAGSRALAFSHFDGFKTKQAVLKIISKLQEYSNNSFSELELQLFGGYAGDEFYSERVFSDVMKAFHEIDTRIKGTLFCVGELNTEYREDIQWPIFYGIGVDVKNGELFPASFSGVVPDYNLRQARCVLGLNEVLDIYDSHSKLLIIGPFSYKPMRYIDSWLEQDDDYILMYMSTSPNVEPPDFIEKIKATLKFIRDNPYPSKIVFVDNKPHCFKMCKETKTWKRLP